MQRPSLRQTWATAVLILGLPTLVIGQTERPQDSSDDPTQAITDSFHGSMRDEWRWLRENQAGWKLTDSGLKVLVEPGNMWGRANDAKNVLLHPVPAAWQDSVDVRVQLEQHPRKRWEQTNLVWYYSDSTMVKIGLEIEHGVTNIVMGREENDRTRTIAIIPYPAESVELRIVVEGHDLQGFYRIPGEPDWIAVGKTTLPDEVSQSPQVSLQFYQGEEDSGRWATASHFEMMPR
ncbi:hypothetical protein [Stieleria mannarensis]|uniref:beta-xylosidase family glycoside hydrolase n=1 Tax=Stieleria mannarensis TaxID=2755585 RepID=UPI0015FF5295|nr:hypothetical protein [Rhodopirellula sp. JC639]